MILENTIKYASKLLKEHNIRSHELDAEIILSNIMGVSKEYLITNGNIDISRKIKQIYNEALKRRINNEPVAYIIGKKEIWSQEFFVNYEDTPLLIINTNNIDFVENVEDLKELLDVIQKPIQGTKYFNPA